jgi:hypothetical protein
MIVDVDEMSRAIVAADETNQLQAERLAMRVVSGQLLAVYALLCANKERTASECVDIFKREGTNILLADGAFDGSPALEVLRTQAVTALEEFCDPIAASLAQHESMAAQAAAEGDQRS